MSLSGRVHRVQLLTLGLFAACLVLAALGVPFLVDLYFLADPLLALHALVASRGPLPIALLLAAAVLVATAVFGRFFCGYVCPMGTCLDLTSPASGRVLPAWARHLKTGILAVVLIAAGTGFGPALAGVLDPLAILWRGLALGVYPLLLGGANLGLDGMRFLDEAVFSSSSMTFDLPQRSLLGAGISLGLLLLALAGNRLAPRFWCRVLCPLGALLALAARWAPYNRWLEMDKCLSCRKCTRTCPMGALADGGRVVALSECIRCQRCIETCPTRAVSLGWDSEWQPNLVRGTELPACSTADPRPTLRRRTVLAASCGLAGLLVADRVALAGPENAPDVPLRPPGSLAEDDFLARCVRCGVCMQACPTNVLQADLAPSSLAGLMAPRLALERGGCDDGCNACGQVCPTGAIAPLGLEAKNESVIGRAVIDRGSCRRSDGRDCRICLEVCPREALALRGGRLVLDGERCNGCGVCELPCPERSARAIRVVSVGEAKARAEPDPAPRSEDHLPLFLRGTQ